MPLENGSTIKHFRLLECAGEDLDGFLYRAEDLQSHRPVSIKEFFPPGLARRSGERIEPVPGAESDYSRMLARFIVVTNQLACIDHPALMRVDDYWLQDGTVYVQMPWYAGQSLQDVLAACQSPVEPAVLEGWLSACAEALKVVHRSRDLHGGLSPDRIMVLEDGQVVLSPLSTEQPMSMLAPQAAAGSEALAAMAASAGLMKSPVAVSQRSLPPWVALEQTELSAGEWTCGPWTDVYALASMASLAITGQMPPNVFQRVEGVPAMTLRPATERGYRAEFLDAIECALSLYPAGRPASISAFMTALGLKEPPAAVHAVAAAVAAPATDETAEVVSATATATAAVTAAVASAADLPSRAIALATEPSDWVEVEPEAEPATAPVTAGPGLQLVPPVAKPVSQAPHVKDRPGVLVWGSAAAAIVAMSFFGPKVFDTWTGTKTATAVTPAAGAVAVPAPAASAKAPAASSSAVPMPALARINPPVPVVAQAVKPKPQPQPKAALEPRKAEPATHVARPAVPPVRPRKPEVTEARVAAARPAMRHTVLAQQDHKPSTLRVSDACADALIRRTLDPSAAAETSPRNACR